MNGTRKNDANRHNEGIALIGMGCVLPDALDVPSFWKNVKTGKYSIREVPADVWPVEDYYDPDQSAPDKTYCKIGAFVRDFADNSMEFRIPPRVWEKMDEVQKWALAATKEALADAGYLDRPFDREKTAVIMGNAMGGQTRLVTAQRTFFPGMERALKETSFFGALPADEQKTALDEFRKRFTRDLPEINEDSMPGELSNVISGRVANVFNLQGANYTTDAACGSSLAALQTAVYGLRAGDFDMAVCGGSDRSMTPDTFVKFSKIGALSADKSCPFDESANGFVMGEGAVVFILKRLSDALRSGDRVYAVIRAIGSSSDGKGKGITAPNVKGQLAALVRAYELAGISPDRVGLIEAHGTSTIAGDQAEIEAQKELFRPFQVPPGSIAIGSIKSQIGHLKSAAGAAGIMKAALSLHHKILPPTVNCNRVSPALQLENSPFYVNTELKQWSDTPGLVRRAGVSSFGFGGTNFHVVVEEYDPDYIKKRDTTQISLTQESKTPSLPGRLLVLGGASRSELGDKLKRAMEANNPNMTLPHESELKAPKRLAIHYTNGHELVKKGNKLLSALESNNTNLLDMLANQGVYVGQGKPGKVAFLFPGQGSQYLNMGYKLFRNYTEVADRFAEADRIMLPRLGKKLSEYIFVQNVSSEELKRAGKELIHTRITQPAVLSLDLAVCELLEHFGVNPDMVIGHSLGEYAALVSAGILSFENALIAASSRAREMSDLVLEDNGLMASVFADINVIRKVLATIEGYVIAANINSPIQTVIAGETEAVKQALMALESLEIKTVLLPVSHAFHTNIIAPAAPRLRKILATMDIQTPQIPIVSNVTGKFYPTTGNVREEILNLLEQQVRSPVVFMDGIESLYSAGARIFLEVGAKKALSGMVRDILGNRPHTTLFSNHPKKDDVTAFGEMLAGLYALGIGKTLSNGMSEIKTRPRETVIQPEKPLPPFTERAVQSPLPHQQEFEKPMQRKDNQDQRYLELGKAVGNFLQMMPGFLPGQPVEQPVKKETPLVISGVSLGLPGRERNFFDEHNFNDILSGQNFIEKLSHEDRERMCRKKIRRLVKRSSGDPTIEELKSPDDMVHLAGMSGHFDLTEFGVPAELCDTMNRSTQLAVAAGILALKDAGIPLVQHYRRTTIGSKLPSHWGLPNAFRDETGVIFASAFSEVEGIIRDLRNYYLSAGRDEIRKSLTYLREKIPAEWKGSELEVEVNNWLQQLEQVDGYNFNRKFVFQALPMGSSQLAQIIGARGPNTHVNAACASHSVALGIAHDWLKAGRCRRVIVVGADDPTGDIVREWIVGGMLALGAATAEKEVSLAALPFDRRRNGMIAGTGAVGMIIEHPDDVHERGMRGLAEFLGIDYCNSAFHASRLHVDHIKGVVDRFVGRMEKQFDINRTEIAPETMFMSHETYTPARGGSASAEVESLRSVFGPYADQVVIANTKGFTGHAMGAGVEEAVTVKSLQMQYVPPVANFREADPDLGNLNLSRGGKYPIQYALKFAAGFGSQLAISLYRRIEKSEQQIADIEKYRIWLRKLSGKEKGELEIVNNTLRIKNGDKPREEKVIPQTPMPIAAEAKAALYQPAEPPASPAPLATIDAQAEHVLEIVATKTGYPRDMLELDLDLEADLGIDTVKQAETFALIREKFEIPQQDDLKLRDYPTLQHLIDYVRDNTSDTGEAGIPDQPVQASSPADSPATADTISESVLEIVAEKTGYPRDMLELDLDLEADLGVDTVKQAETFALIREKFEIPQQDDLKLRDYPTLQHLIDYVRQHVGDTPTQTAPPVNTQPVPDVAQSQGDDHIAAAVLAIVAEKTGYPEDMLELDLDLEADLGVDTVKQAETFAQIREQFSLPKQEDLKLRDYPTLQHLIKYVRDNTESQSVSEQPVVAASSPLEKSAPIADPVTETVLEIVAEKTGYPVDMLELDLDLEADLGVDTVKQAETFARIRERFELPKQEDLKLRDYPTLQHLIDYVRSNTEITQNPAQQTETDIEDTDAMVITPETARDIDDPVTSAVLEIVADKTGYPEDMLELDLDLEADLGVDTVKQAETFAQIRERFELPKQEDLKLRDYPTLQHLINYVKENQAEPETKDEATDPSTASSADTGTHGEHVSQQGSPLQRLVPELIAAPLSGDEKPAPCFVGKPVVIITDDGADGVYHHLKPLFEEAGARVVVLSENKEETGDDIYTTDFSNSDTLIDTLGQIRTSCGSVRGLVHLAGLTDAPDIVKTTLEAWKKETSRRIKSLFIMAQTLAEDLSGEDSEGQPFVLSATTLGGSFGFPEVDHGSPLDGGITGLTKALAKEFPTSRVKVCDFDGNTDSQVIAETLYHELVHGDDRTEISFHNGHRHHVQVVPTPLPEAALPQQEFDNETVFVFTGGAQGITAEIAADVATYFKPNIAILDIVELPENIEELASLDEQGIDDLKQQVREDLSKKEKRVTPVMLEKHFSYYTRAITAWNTITRLRETGARVSYFRCDVLDGEAVDFTLGKVAKEFGKIDVLVHGAGLEESRSIENKKLETFHRIFDVKVDGCFNLFRASIDHGLKQVVFFASVAGRFGNIGQTDYSAANDLLNKFAAWINGSCPGIRAVAMNWTGWADVGMATKSTIKQIFDEAGITMIPLAVGKTLVRQEILFGNRTAEVVIAGELGFLDSQDQIVSPAESTEAVNRQALLVQKKELFALLDSVSAVQPEHSIILKRKISLERDLYLNDHAIDEVPLFPGVMGLEAFTQAARLLFPELNIVGMENVEFKQALKVFAGKQTEMFVYLEREPSHNGVRKIRARLQSDFIDAKGRKLGKTRTHFEGTVILDTELEEGGLMEAGLADETVSRTLDRSEIYSMLFHGPIFQVCENASLFEKKGMTAIMHPTPDNVMESISPVWNTHPFKVELGFQAAGLYELLHNDRLGLPHRIESIRFYSSPDKTGEVQAQVFPGEEDETGFYILITMGSRKLIEINGYKTVNLTDKR